MLSNTYYGFEKFTMVPFVPKTKNNLKSNEKIKAHLCETMMQKSTFMVPLSLKHAIKPVENNPEWSYTFDELHDHINILEGKSYHGKSKKVNKNKHVHNHNKSDESKEHHDLTLFIANCSSLKDHSHQSDAKDKPGNENIFSELKEFHLVLEYTLNIKSHSKEHCGHSDSHFSYEEVYILEFNIIFLAAYIIMSAIFGFKYMKNRSNE